MVEQIAVERWVVAPKVARASSWGLLPDLSYKRLAIVNVAFLTTHAGWILIDAGLPGTASLIQHAAKELYGDRQPLAILLTHGHFDHVGALRTLLSSWDVPVYAHPDEQPFLSGARPYPPPDPRSDSGMLALLSTLYPRSPIDIGDNLQSLPSDGSVPHLEGWRWLHTPGHAPGHVSFWRESDRTLLAGDAVVTTRQEAVYSVTRQELEMHGPPRYFTPDWASAAASVRRLAALDPELLLAGHGRPMAGPAMRNALNELAANFEDVAVPKHGRYARR